MRLGFTFTIHLQFSTFALKLIYTTYITVRKNLLKKLIWDKDYQHADLRKLDFLLQTPGFCVYASSPTIVVCEPHPDTRVLHPVLTPLSVIIIELSYRFSP